MPSPFLRKKIKAPLVISSGPSYTEDVDAEAFFTACEADGYPVTNTSPYYYKARYTLLIQALKTTGQWAITDCIFIDNTGNREWALRDIRTPSRKATISGTVTHTANVGFTGDGTTGYISTGFNPSVGGLNWTKDSATFGYLQTTNTTSGAAWHVGQANALYTKGSMVSSNGPLAHVYHCINSTNLNPTTTTATSFPKISAKGWYAVQRTSSTIVNVYCNGCLLLTQTNTSDTIQNQQFIRFQAGPVYANAGFYDPNSQAGFYAGSGAINTNTIAGVITEYWTRNINSTTGVVRRIIFEGDSQTGSADAGSTYSNDSEYCKTTLTSLGTKYTGVVKAKQGDTLALINTNLATQITNQLNIGWERDVVSVFAGTNDLASGSTAATAYSLIQTIGNAIKATGAKCIIYTIPDRRGSFTGGQTQGGFDSARATFNANLRADFPTSTAYTNIFTGGSYADAMIDLSADVNFQDASNTGYFMVDTIHFASALRTSMASYCTNAINLVV